MADIWSGIGVDISSSEGDWLYRVGSEMRGPVSHRVVVDKLLSGEIDLDTPVGREGGEFHPISRVAAFADHLQEAQAAKVRRAARRTRKLIALLSLPVLGMLGVAGFVMHSEFQKRQQQARERAPATTAAATAPGAKDLPKMGLVALVSLGTHDDVQIRGKGKQKSAPPGGSTKRGRAKERQEAAAAAGGEEEEFTSSCKLSQQDIFGTLKDHLLKLNVCVEDEKKRDTQGLLPSTLVLDFVVKPNGKVVEFRIEDRHYRTGPMNNCMIKAFNTITFPTSTGSNCPVTIPLKIGK